MVYERYDGHGFPNRLGAEDISLAAQIVQLAEAVTLHLQLVGRDGALAMLRERRGRAFRPDVVDCVLDDAAALTDELDDPWAEVLAMEPGGAPVLDGERVDDVLVAIADFADLKSPYTAGHSRSVASLAGGRRPRLRAPRRRRHRTAPRRVDPRRRADLGVGRGLGQARAAGPRRTSRRSACTPTSPSGSSPARRSSPRWPCWPARTTSGSTAAAITGRSAVPG